MPISERTIATIRHMPVILERIDTEIIAAPHVTEVKPAVNRILQEENYPLSKIQQVVFDRGASAFQAEKAGTQAAQEWMTRDFRTARRAFTRGIGVRDKDVLGYTFHPSSITFAISHPAFRKKWLKEKPDDTTLPRGFTGTDMSFPMQKRNVPYSFRNALNSDESTAAHEHDHKENRYFHPTLLDGDYFPSREALLDLTKTAVETNNFKTVADELGNMVYTQLTIFLDELQATAARRTGVIDQFIGPQSGYYGQNYRDRIDAIRSNFPKRLGQRLNWEMLVWSAQRELNHKMSFIERAYLDQVAANVPSRRLRNNVRCLLPEQGYLMNALNPNHEPTPAEIKEWMREYHFGWIPKDSVSKVNYWADFLTDVGTELVTPDQSLETTKQQFRLWAAKKRHRVLFGVPHPNEGPQATMDIGPIEEQIEPYIDAVRELTQRRAHIFNGVMTYLKGQPELNAKERRKIRNRVALRLLSPQERVFDLSEAYHYAVNFVFSREEMNVRFHTADGKDRFEQMMADDYEKLAERLLQLDDAAEEILEDVVHYREPDYDTVFAPGFTRDDEKRKRALHYYTSHNRRGKPGLPALEYESFIFFRSWLFNDLFVAGVHGRSVDFEEPDRKITSSLTRLLQWAKNSQLDDQRIERLQETLILLYTNKRIPSTYLSLLQRQGLIPR